jgi:hypothetical protein
MPRLVKFVVLPLLVVAGGAAVWVAVTSGGGTTAPEREGIVALVPGEGDLVLLQSRVGVVVQPGWEARLSVNGVTIPDDQLDEALEPGQRLFQPGPGKVIAQLEPNNNCVTAQVWPLAAGPDRSTVRTWCFRAN